MSIKKLTVAAAIAVGIATCSLTPAMAACPCNTKAPDEALPVVTGPACPVATPQPQTCTKCIANARKNNLAQSKSKNLAQRKRNLIVVVQMK